MLPEWINYTILQWHGIQRVHWVVHGNCAGRAHKQHIPALPDPTYKLNTCTRCVDGYIYICYKNICQQHTGNPKNNCLSFLYHLFFIFLSFIFHFFIIYFSFFWHLFFIFLSCLFHFLSFLLIFFDFFMDFWCFAACSTEKWGKYDEHLAKSDEFQTITEKRKQNDKKMIKKCKKNDKKMKKTRGFLHFLDFGSPGFS